MVVNEDGAEEDDDPYWLSSPDEPLPTAATHRLHGSADDNTPTTTNGAQHGNQGSGNPEQDAEEPLTSQQVLFDEVVAELAAGLPVSRTSWRLVLGDLISFIGHVGEGTARAVFHRDLVHRLSLSWYHNKAVLQALIDVAVLLSPYNRLQLAGLVPLPELVHEDDHDNWQLVGPGQRVPASGSAPRVVMAFQPLGLELAKVWQWWVVYLAGGSEELRRMSGGQMRRVHSSRWHVVHGPFRVWWLWICLR